MPEELHQREFWHNYWKKQNRPSSTEGWEPHIVDIFDNNLPKEGKKILEVGCGPGALKKLLEERAPERDITGVDFSLSKDKLQTKQFVEGNAEDLPFPDNSFDAGYSSFLLTHVDMKKATEEMWRVLKPGAKLVLLIHKKNSSLHTELIERYNNAHRWIRYRKRDLVNGVGNKEEVTKQLEHNQELMTGIAPLVETIDRAFETPEEAKEFFEDYGFTVEHAGVVGSDPKKVFKGHELGISLILKKSPEQGNRTKLPNPIKKLEQDPPAAGDDEDEGLEYSLG